MVLSNGMSQDDFSHTELVNNFMEICAVEQPVAERILQRYNWNLESAVQDYFQSGGSQESWEGEQNLVNRENELRRRHASTNGPSTSSSESRQTPTPPVVRLQRRPLPPMTWFQWTLSLLRLPFDFTYYCFIETLQFLWTLLRGPPLAVADPRGDVQKFIEDFDQRYGDATNKICWQNSPYNDALNECKKNLRFMLVYLHNPSHEACDRFVRETLLSYQMKQLIIRNNLILWGASVRSQEGYKVSMALRENTYPFLGLICMRDNRMVMVLRLEGEYELEPMLFSIQNAINENQVHLDAVRKGREQREADNRIRREQEADYQLGLAADRAKLDEKRKEELEKKKALERAEEERLERERKAKKFAEMKENLRKELPAESAEQECVRVIVRFPCGARLERKFGLDESLEMLFIATLVHEKCPMDFSMYTNYPRKQLNCAPDWYREFGMVMNNPQKIPTFREAAFEKSATVFVQNNDA